MTIVIFMQNVCRTIAVVLHYSFLVTFMWMLMEGVVLYVALVKVFVTKPRRYIISFTVISYGQFIKLCYIHVYSYMCVIICMYICSTSLGSVPAAVHVYTRKYSVIVSACHSKISF